jgi:hypothetical protein
MRRVKRKMVGVSSTMIYFIYCKNFVNVTMCPQHNRKKKFKKKGKERKAIVNLQQNRYKVKRFGSSAASVTVVLQPLTFHKSRFRWNTHISLETFNNKF